MYEMGTVISVAHADSTSSACPVAHDKHQPAPTSDSGGGCPVDHSKRGNGGAKMYNVYNQVIDPTNQMPSKSQQVKAPGQKMDLPMDRVTSNIPKGGATDGTTWQYPSPQMFWNALVRKNKTEGASEADIESVVAVHNNMNENTWKQVLAWENLHVDDEGGKGGDASTSVKLLRFLGKPDDLSPLAQVKYYLFGNPKPFDRHDWYVLRPNGQEVRYVIDYYHDESQVNKDQAPSSMHDIKALKSIQLDVRPALDSFESFIDRFIKMPYYLKYDNSKAVEKYKPLPLLASNQQKDAMKMKKDKMSKVWNDIRANCETRKIALAECKDDTDCTTAYINLRKCTASFVCPDTVHSFNACIESNANDDKIEQSFNDIEKCLEMFEIESKEVMAAKIE